MKAYIKSGLFFFLVACSSAGNFTYAAKNRQEAIMELSEKIKSDLGLKLEVHGARHESRAYVGTFVYDNIFNALHVSLLTKNEAVREVLSSLTRHDVIRVWGHKLDIESPQPHLSIDRIIIEKKFPFPGQTHTPPTNWNEVAKELEGLSHIVVDIHAVAEEGKLLVVEYKGFVFPIFTKEFSRDAKDLNRQDFAKIYFEIQEKPGRPIHFELQEGPNGKAIELIDSIATQHGIQKTLSGPLVMFPQSPSIRFNVFAVKFQTEFKIPRTYTLINFENPELFAAIRTKLQKAWDESIRLNDKCLFNDRNKLTNKCLVVEASGKINHVDPNQANPQVLIDNIEDVKVRSP